MGRVQIGRNYAISMEKSVILKYGIDRRGGILKLSGQGHNLKLELA